MNEDIEFLEGPFPRGNENKIFGAPSNSMNQSFSPTIESIREPTNFVIQEYKEQSKESREQPREPPMEVSILPVRKTYMNINCIEIDHHLRECPVCSKLHKSSSPIFIGIIIALLIIILFLGRKFFE